MKIEYKLTTVDQLDRIETVWFSNQFTAENKMIRTKVDYDIAGARLTKHVTVGKHVRTCIETIDEWGDIYSVPCEKMLYLIPDDIFLEEIRALRSSFISIRHKNFESASRSIGCPGILFSRIKGVRHISEVLHYDEEKDRCSFSYILYLEKGENVEDYIIPDTVGDISVKSYGEWKKELSIGREAFKDRTGYNYQF